MEASVKRVTIFSLAEGAQVKSFHRCQRSVIGGFFDQGKARAAVGAVDKRIQITPVIRVKKFLQAVVADI